MASEAETRLALALEAAQLGTWTWDMAAGTTVWDTRLEQLHGLEPGGFGGTYEDWLAAVHPADRDECLARVEHALASPGPYLLLHRTTWPDGTVRWIECRGRVTVDGAGAPTGTIGVAIDVTEREDHGAVVAEQLEQEQCIVAALQQALLPSELPTVPGVSVAARYVPASGPAEIGGDWYAVVPLAGRALGLGIGDVAGHGLGAVADMANARFSVRALALTETEPECVLDRLDEVVRVFDDNVLITALYGIVDPDAAPGPTRLRAMSRRSSAVLTVTRPGWTPATDRRSTVGRRTGPTGSRSSPGRGSCSTRTGWSSAGTRASTTGWPGSAPPAPAGRPSPTRSATTSSTSSWAVVAPTTTSPCSWSRWTDSEHRTRSSAP